MKISKKDVENIKRMNLPELEAYMKSLDEYAAKGNDASAWLEVSKEHLETLLRKQQELKDFRYNLSNLNEYVSIPRSASSEFFKDIARKAPFFSKAKWMDKFQNAPIVYGAVVQAHQALWSQGDATNVGIVFVFSSDERYMHDIEWLSQTAHNIMSIKNSQDVPKDVKELVKSLRNEQSYFCLPLADSLSNGVQAWCATYTIENQSLLLNNVLPGDRIVPFILKEKPKNNQFIDIKLIPSKYL